jgi:hypothetical protein
MVCGVALASALLLFAPAPTAHADGGPTLQPEAGQADASSGQPAEPQRHADAQAGYRFVSPVRASSAAEPYSLLRSGVAGGLSVGVLGPDLKLSVEGMALHEDDYHAEMFLDYGGYVRLHAESEALWHNLGGEQLPPSSPTGQYLTRQTLPPDLFGVRTAISQAESRIKFGNNPIHLTLGYWELRREGTEQIRFSDHYFGDAGSTIIAAGRPVDQVTREGKVAADAHLRFFDLAYTFLVREFSNEAPDYRNDFRVTGGGALTAGSQATNAVAGSRVTSHTIRLYTDMSGGLTGTAAYSLTRRENNADRGDARPSGRPVETLQTVAGDITYTPVKDLSFAVKYRRQEIDHDSPATVSYPYVSPGVLTLLPPVDSTRNTVVVTGSYRPDRQLVCRLEYRATLETRDNLPDDQTTPGGARGLHSEETQIHSGGVNLSWKPSPAFRITSAYRYSTTRNPEWATEASDSHRGELFLTYGGTGVWGATASFITTFESGSRSASTVSPAPAAHYNLPRDYRSHSAAANLWFSPRERLTISTSYSYLATASNQSILFADLISDPSPVTATDYQSSAHVYGIDALYALAEQVDLSLAFQQVFSRSRFSMPDRVFTLAGVAGTFSTAGISGLTRLDATESGVRARVDWHATRHAGCSLDYSFRKYRSGNPLFDGSVHTTMLSLTARW